MTIFSSVDVPKKHALPCAPSSQPSPTHHLHPHQQQAPGQHVSSSQALYVASFPSQYSAAASLAQPVPTAPAISQPPSDLQQQELHQAQHQHASSYQSLPVAPLSTDVPASPHSHSHRGQNACQSSARAPAVDDGLVEGQLHDLLKYLFGWLQREGRLHSVYGSGKLDEDILVTEVEIFFSEVPVRSIDAFQKWIASAASYRYSSVRAFATGDVCSRFLCVLRDAYSSGRLSEQIRLFHSHRAAASSAAAAAASSSSQPTARTSESSNKLSYFNAFSRISHRCPVCSESFQYEDELQVHNLMEHGEDNDSDSNPDVPSSLYLHPFFGPSAGTITAHDAALVAHNLEVFRRKHDPMSPMVRSQSEFPTKDVFGQWRGIEGHCNSCYFDVLAMAMFAFHNRFDELFSPEKLKRSHSDDATLLRLLGDLVVRPLRERMFVSRSAFAAIRLHLSEITKESNYASYGLMDPSELLMHLDQHLPEGLKCISSYQSDVKLYSDIIISPVNRGDEVGLTAQKLLEIHSRETGLTFDKAPKAFFLQMRLDIQSDQWFPPSPVVQVPVSDLSQAAIQTFAADCSPESTAPYGLCSVDFRFYSDQASPGIAVSIELRCFPVNGERGQQLCQMQIPRKEQGFAATANSRVYAEWKDVRVPCRSVLEITFVFGWMTDTHLVHVGQVSKLFVLARAEAELIRCLSDVPHDNWFAKCGPNLSSGSPSSVKIILPQQFSSDRYTKIMLFDLKEEDWNMKDSLTFRKLQIAASSAFLGVLRPGNYRIYLWDNNLQKWIMDCFVLTVPESVGTNSAVLFGHNSETDKHGCAGFSRFMDAQLADLLSMQTSCPLVTSSRSPSFLRSTKFARMELAAVTCISRSHHVAFLRLPDLGADGRHRWAFYDSMSEIQKGHRIPILFEVPGLANYFENGYDASCLPLQEDGPSRDSFVQRLQKNAFMSLYISSTQ